MAQNYTADMFAPGNQVQVDMQNIENNLECLRSMFSGMTFPNGAIQGQAWYDLSKSVSKQYNGEDWVGHIHGDLSQKVWIYRNGAMPGWVVDASVGDQVLVIKNTIAGQVYSSAGSVAGAWSIAGLSAGQSSHTHYIAADGNHRHSLSNTIEGKFTTNKGPYYTNYPGGHSHGYTGYTEPAVTTQQNGAWRPAAAVGALQYLDL